MLDQIPPDLLQELQAAAKTMQAGSLSALFAQNPDRFSQFSLSAAGLLLDYSKNPLDAQNLSLLLKMADSQGIASAFDRFFKGDVVNISENRAALHPVCRMPDSAHLELGGHDQVAVAQQQLDAMQAIVERLHNKKWLGYTGLPITDVVNVGIGGSDLGPAMCVQALQSYACSEVGVHFISNIDLVYLKEQLTGFNPATTLFIIASKSFSTTETLQNATFIKQWLLAELVEPDAVKSHFMAVSSHVERAVQFGIAQDNILPMWQEVGGRYSIWTAVGLPLAISIGMPAFKQFLAGAYAMDLHAREADFRENMPVILALIDVWLGNFMQLNNRAIIPYSHYLQQFPDYLQQLCMESQGKSVNQQGEAIDYPTGMIIWGGCGTNSQHSFHQLLLQGNQKTCIDFIVPKYHYNGDMNIEMLANCFAQSQVLMQGYQTETIGYQSIAGNVASNTLIMDKLDPSTLGALIALYEHKVFAQSVIWDINPFDQWGVERGKVLAQQLATDLSSGYITGDYDSSTFGLLSNILGDQ